MATHPRRSRLLLALLLLAAFALRVYRLDSQSLWWDEGISLHLATSGLGEIVRDRLGNIHPPLYFFMLKGWLALVGVSPFTGRYLSVLASLGQVAVVFGVVGYWSGRVYGRRSPLPWLAAVLLLISPLSVIYGQEIRVYAMLPLVYLGMVWAAERLLGGGRPATRGLIALAILEWLGLHLHYIALFAVAYIGLWGTLSLWRRRDGIGLRRWVLTHAVVVLASLPWLLAVLGNRAAVAAEAAAGTFVADPVPPAYLLGQVWAFHLTGLAGATASRFVQVAAAAAAVLLAALFAARVMAGGRGDQAANRRTVLLRLAAYWLVPLAAGLAVWSVRSFSHPRYIVMFTVMFIPVSAWLLYPSRRWVERVLALVLACCLIALSLWGLARYFFDPEAAKPDMRGVARYLETVAAPDDLILIPDTDWSLPFEYGGPAAVLMPRLDESPHDGTAVLSRALDCTGDPCSATGRVFVVDYPQGTRDWQDRLPFELARRGDWVGETTFDDVRLREYRLKERPGPLPGCDDAGLLRPAARFGPLRLEAAWVEQGAAADTAVAVALCWRLSQPVGEPFVVSLVLRDPVTGERIAQTDAALLNSLGASTTHWTTDETVVTYHLLPLPPGTPPVDAHLSLGVYGRGDAAHTPVEALDEQGQPVGLLFPLGNVALGSPTGLPSLYSTEALPLWAEPVTVAGGALQLLGARFSPGPYRPGQTVRVGLVWRANDAPPGDIRPALVMEQDGRLPVENREAPVNGRYPTDRWGAGERVFEYRDIRIPADAGGVARLVVVAGDERIELGEVTIDGAAVLFERPDSDEMVEASFGNEGITLVGFDRPPEALSATQPIDLTLYWHLPAGGVTSSYTVFTHLLAEDGRLLAQHDAPPDNGRRPTNEWLPGEYVIDPHELTWRESGYIGPARLAVGLYDPATGERLTLAGGGDAFVLPILVSVR